jgi:hypothetical protein
MKKIFLVVFSFMMLSLGPVMAQDSKSTATKKEVKKSAKADDSKAEPAAKMKKDGTPDMRYKENKAAKEEAKPSGPLKKDGTPDKRYKANKEAEGKGK